MLGLEFGAAPEQGAWRMTTFDAHGTASALLDRANNGEGDLVAATRAFKALSLRLTPVLGMAAAQALLARSVVLASARFPELARMSDRNDALTHLSQCLDEMPRAEVRVVATDVMTTLLELLVTLIGEDVTARLAAPRRVSNRKEGPK